MIDLKRITLNEILPDNLAKDETVKAVAEALNGTLQQIAEQTQNCLLIARLDTLPEKVVDHLAWQYHVDFYEYDLPLKTKRNLVRQTIGWHRRKGTPWAVQEVVTALLDGAKVLESWEFGGEPYHFKVEYIDGAMPDMATFDRLIRAINATKNTRSWLDGVSFYRAADAPLYFGGALCAAKSVEISPSTIKMPDVNGGTYYGIANYTHKEVTIHG